MDFPDPDALADLTATAAGRVYGHHIMFRGVIVHAARTSHPARQRRRPWRGANPARPRAIQAGHQAWRIDRSLGHLSRQYRPHIGCRSAARDRGDEAASELRRGPRQRRPSEQARRRRDDRPPVVRPGHRCHDRCADFLGSARGRAGGQGKRQDHAQRIGHGRGVDLAAVQPELHRVELRHLRERAQHRAAL